MGEDILSENLPRGFAERMNILLGEEYEVFIKSYEKPRALGLRFNTLKGETETFACENGQQFGLRKVPWCPEGFYYGEDKRPGRHPFHEAGVYYIQEPSAMAVVSLLNPVPGETVLDLCGAPGGKSTHIGSRMKGQGLLVSNEIHPARARILSRNVERMGIRNVVVFNEDSARLADCFPEFFDKIVVDAPCSGEGMFRKDENAREQWSLENVRLCAKRQKEILENAARMLKPGGRMVYSTCTFSPEEDEGQVAAFLEAHPEFFVVELPKDTQPLGLSAGRGEWGADRAKELSHTFRIWPHQSEGEGHYMALLEKSGKEAAPEIKKGKASKRQKKQREKEDVKRAEQIFRQFIQELTGAKERFNGTDILSMEGKLILFGDQIYCIPQRMPDLDGLRVIRPGLHLGTLKKDRFEPSHALALALDSKKVKKVIHLEPEGREAADYLAGKILTTESGKAGWVLICVGDYPLGWGKVAAGIVKNHYPKGLRISG
ncbi:MAG: NOL1/NOP2/sun family putative RNA methylase [Lachnospiraceae bacterium]|jgi:NOL1/NOP2/sun family putative RNA methylase|nr:NOL1/NOP2/sun family putative RNA methylase [Lachnospiraceae bacterium]